MGFWYVCIVEWRAICLMENGGFGSMEESVKASVEASVEEREEACGDGDQE